VAFLLGTCSLFAPEILEWLHLWRAFGKFESAVGTHTYTYTRIIALITLFLFVFNQLF